MTDTMASNAAVLGGAVADLLRDVYELGWASTDLSIGHLLSWADQTGVRVVPTRPSDGPIGLLRPTSGEAAHPRSLSAVYGLGAFPLHTDGAHRRVPPSVVVLSKGACAGSVAPTMVLPISRAMPAPWTAMTQGVFRVGGRDGFLSHVVDAVGTVRFDRACMHPMDPLADAVVEWMGSLLVHATQIEWGVHSTIVIDNRRTLHGRAPVIDSSGRELHRLMLDWDDPDGQSG